MITQEVIYRDLGLMDYREAWDYQEALLQENLRYKAAARETESKMLPRGAAGTVEVTDTRHYLLFVEHPPVYTLGKSGNPDHVLIGEEELKEKGIAFFHTNRGGDITYHGPGQIVGYPILDLEKFTTDIGRYLRNLEEVIIRTMADYRLSGERSTGETGVWLEPGIPGKARKICAIGVRCSRWVTMHGFALNVDTDLSYFNHIIPCGISNKQVTSLAKELGYSPPLEEVRERIRGHFETVFGAKLVG